MAKNVMKTLKNIVIYTKCSVKMLTNFYKCAIYYFLDILKYIFLFLIPGFILMCFYPLFRISWKKWKEIFNRYKYIIDWGNSIQNACYRCKNKKEKKKSKKNTNQKSKKKKMVGSSLSPLNFSFYYFFIAIMGLLVSAYFVYYLIPKK